MRRATINMQKRWRPRAVAWGRALRGSGTWSAALAATAARAVLTPSGRRRRTPDTEPAKGAPDGRPDTSQTAGSGRSGRRPGAP